MLVDTIDELVSCVGDGCKLAIPVTRSAPSIAATRAIITKGVRDLHLVAIPTAGLQADMLIGAGCVKTVESAGITLDEFGQAPRFVEAVKNGTIKLMDTTCPALVSGLQAGEKGIPFIPMRGLLGTDLLKYRLDYRVIDNPMSEEKDPVVLLPAIVPDVAVIHAPLADTLGNVWIGKARELMTMAHASKKTIVTVEQVIEEDLMADPLRAPATIPGLYVSSISIARNGAAPLGLDGHYNPDAATLSRYVAMAKSAEGFAEYMGQESIAVAAE